MYLTKEQEKIMDGEKGEALAKLMNLIVKIGTINNAKKLIPITNAQIAGVSYYNVGKAIFSFFDLLLQDNLKAKVPSWLNPAGMDLIKYEEMGIDQSFAQNQLKIIESYQKLGIKATLTCTPYLIGNIPRFQEHLAWSESSAVVMANSYYGAKTNREGAPSSLASALTGLTAEYGLHLMGNRMPDIIVDINTPLTSPSDFSALGYWFGEHFKGRIPLFTSVSHFSIEDAKLLSSAVAASGNLALYHVENFTPEAKNLNFDDKLEHLTFTKNDKKKIYAKFHSSNQKIDLVVIGCPHASVKEVELVYSKLVNKKLLKNSEFWIFTSRKVANDARVKIILSKLERKGVHVYTDTCMVVSPSVMANYKTIATNSSKAAFYLSKNATNELIFESLDKIIKMVTK